MTDQYAVRRAEFAPGEVLPEAVGLQWKHSILSIPGFVSPWQAVETAADLAFELNPSSFISQGSPVDYAAIWPKTTVLTSRPCTFKPS